MAVGALCLATVCAGRLLTRPVPRPLTTAQAPVPPDQASTSTRGVTAHTINVVFPVANLQALASVLGFAGDYEYKEQTKAINLFVNQINDRRRDQRPQDQRRSSPISTPTNENDMRSLCKTWTEGSPAAFAVLDGVGTWSGDNQLCITQEGHTPLISQWTTVTNWTTAGLPLPVVDRTRRRRHPAGRGELGARAQG